MSDDNELMPFRATDPKRVGEALSRWEAEADAWDKEVQAWAESHGGKPAIIRDNTFNEHTLVGIFVEGDETPENWRRFKTKEHLEPNRNRKAGKALVEEMRELSKRHPGHLRKVIVREFGVPEHLGLFATFGFAPVPAPPEEPTDYFVLWRASHGWEGNEHFAPCKRSEFYAAKEQAEEMAS